jgi:hypothetical protein
MQMYAERGDLAAESRPNMQSLTVLREGLDRAIGEAVDHYALERDHARDREIPSDVLPRLFDAFSTDRSEQAHGGLGLGLYIVQQIAHAHGGEVVCEFGWRRDDGACAVATNAITSAARVKTLARHCYRMPHLALC